MEIPQVDLVYGPTAEALLRDPQFLARWRALYAECPHATAYQAPGFVCAWYGVYRDQWKPVLVKSGDANGKLSGLWLLAHDPAANAIAHAGTHQAEYHAWLAAPGHDQGFLVAAWAELKGRFAFTTLRFKYLPDPGLVATLRSALGTANPFEAKSHDRPLLTLNKEEIRESFAKKSNKSRFNRIMKLGKVEFRRLTDPAELESAFGDLITFYDFRQGAVNNSTPFRSDPRKRQFHTELFAAEKDEVYVTGTFLDGKPIAAFWGTATAKMVHLGMIIYSPFLAKHSVGKLHIMQLSEKLLESDKAVLDLTPGGDAWKERFSNSHDKVAEAILYNSRLAYVKVAAQSGLLKLIKGGAARLGLSNDALKSVATRLRVAKPANAYRELRAWVGCEREMTVYRIDRALAKNPARDGRFQRDSLGDLLLFAPAGPHASGQGILSSSLSRLENGESVVTLTKGGRLALYGWMAVDQTEYILEEVNQPMALPAGSAYIHDLWLHPNLKAEDDYRAAIGHILSLAFSDKTIQSAYMAVSADQTSHRKEIEAMGFAYHCSYHLASRYGHERKWDTAPIAPPPAASQPAATASGPVKAAT
jgi:CelD/BcsL family acetyltransferase involved in cellulose biosynthesis